MPATNRLALALASVLSLPLIGLACHVDASPANAPAADTVDADPSDVKRNGIELGIADLGGGGILVVEGGNIGSYRLTQVSIDKSIFLGKIATPLGEVEVDGLDFLGAQLQVAKIGEAADGSVTSERLDAVVTHVIDLGTGVFAHEIEFFDPTNNSYVPACPNAGLAVVLQGSWDAESGDALGGASNELTIACMGGALSKCTEWGYHGWDSPAMAQTHQACTRAVRADFCGDGQANTYNGTQIDIYDVHGVEARATTWPVEAEWGPDGAVCRGPSMRSNGDDLHCLTNIPVTATCGKLTSNNGGEIATRYLAM